MTLKSPRVVRVEKAEASFGEMMNRIRLWLDSHKIEPTEFKTEIPKPGAVAFDIRFKSEDEAYRFEQEFALAEVARIGSEPFV